MSGVRLLHWRAGGSWLDGTVTVTTVRPGALSTCIDPEPPNSSVDSRLEQREPMAFGRRRCVESRTVVLDCEVKDVAALLDSDCDGCAVARAARRRISRCSRRASGATTAAPAPTRRRPRRNVVAQPIAEAHALDVQIVADDAKFVLERHERGRSRRRATTASATRAASSSARRRRRPRG